MSSGIPIFTQDGSPITTAKAIDMVRQGLQQFKDFGIANHGLEKVYKKLVALSSK